MPAVYNEIDPFAAQWMRNLIAAGHIAPGVVYERSVRAIQPADVAGPGQRHFFAGIGAWSYALRIAGVPDSADIWTGSCPCQPFSDAGARGGFDDDRHLWPDWFKLIRECRPAIVFGEQVAGGFGLEWLDAVSSDLEGAGYAVGAADLCAASVGAPHIRQRFYLVAIAEGERRPAWWDGGASAIASSQSQRLGDARTVADADDERRRIVGARRSVERVAQRRDADGRGPASGLGVSGGERRSRRDRGGTKARPARGSRATGVALGDARSDRDQQHARELPRHEGEHAQRSAHGDHASVDPGATRGPWYPADWIPCSDGVARPVEPGAFPLAHGAPARVGRLRGYGNGIVAPLAAVFIRAALDAIGDR